MRYNGAATALVRRAKQKGITVLAIKAMAYSRWSEGEPKKYPDCWYRPSRTSC